MLKVGTVIFAACVFTSSAGAQDWPARPLTMVVPFAAGGPAEVPMRILAPRMSELLGQQVIIENVGGAGGTLGLSRLAKAPPDGYQFAYGNNGTHAHNQILYKTPRYNAVADFQPVGLLWTSTRVLIVRPTLPVATLPEFIAYAKANQTSMQYGSSGAGGTTHIACLLLNTALGVNVTHVPYRGTGPAMQDLIAGRIDYLCDATQNALPHIQAGTAKPIALLSPRRTPVLPDLATADEQGLSGFDVDGWGAFFLPKGTADTIVRRLNKAASDALDVPAIRERLDSIDVRVVPPDQRAPEHLAKLIPAEIDKSGPAIRASGVTID